MYGRTLDFLEHFEALRGLYLLLEIVIADAEKERQLVPVDFLFCENGRIIVMAVRAPWKACGICVAADVNKVPIKTEEQTPE